MARIRAECSWTEHVKSKQPPCTLSITQLGYAAPAGLSELMYGENRDRDVIEDLRHRLPQR
jgi:hypothetical protein